MSDNNIGNMLSSILSDEKSAEKISSIISSLGMSGNNGSSNAENLQNNNQQNPLSSLLQNMDIGSILNGVGGLSNIGGTETKDHRHNLLLSLKPFLNENRSKNVDKAIGALKIMNVINSMKGKGL